MSTSTGSFGAREVMRETGVSYRQLDYWTMTGVVTASIRDEGGSGQARRYSADDIESVRRIKALIDLGFGWTAIRRMTRDQWERVADAVQRELASPSSRFPDPKETPK